MTRHPESHHTKFRLDRCSLYQAMEGTVFGLIRPKSGRVGVGPSWGIPWHPYSHHEKFGLYRCSPLQAIEETVFGPIRHSSVPGRIGPSPKIWLEYPGPKFFCHKRFFNCSITGGHYGLTPKNVCPFGPIGQVAQIIFQVVNRRRILSISVNICLFLCLFLCFFVCLFVPYRLSPQRSHRKTKYSFGISRTRNRFRPQNI